MLVNNHTLCICKEWCILLSQLLIICYYHNPSLSVNFTIEMCEHKSCEQ